MRNDREILDKRKEMVEKVKRSIEKNGYDAQKVSNETGIPESTVRQVIDSMKN